MSFYYFFLKKEWDINVKVTAKKAKQSEKRNFTCMSSTRVCLLFLYIYQASKSSIVCEGGKNDKR